MELAVYHPGHMCSSLALVSLTPGIYERRSFVEVVKSTVATYNSARSGVYPNYVSYHAFIIASTVDSQKWAAQGLKELGFTCRGPQFNEKNKTNCTFWILDVRTFLKNLEKANSPKRTWKLIDGIRKYSYVTTK